MGALDGAEWHAVRVGPAATGLSNRVFVWGIGAVVYALLEVAKQIEVAGRARKR